MKCMNEEKCDHDNLEGEEWRNQKPSKKEMADAFMKFHHKCFLGCCIFEDYIWITIQKKM